MSASDNLITNIAKVGYTSYFDMDKIIGSAQGTFSMAASTGVAVTSTNTSPTSFGENYYFQGVYSTDNGASWNDFNVMVPDLSTPSTPIFQTVEVFGAVGSSGTMNIFGINYYDSVHHTGYARTIKWKVLYFAKNQQGTITPQYPAIDTTSFTTIDRVYQKIFLKNSVPFNLTSGAAKSISITHNLGYVPRIRAFYQQISPGTRLDNLWETYRIDTHLTETDVTFALDAYLSTATVTGNIEYRIYYD